MEMYIFGAIEQQLIFESHAFIRCADTNITHDLTGASTEGESRGVLVFTGTFGLVQAPVLLCLSLCVMLNPSGTNETLMIMMEVLCA